MNTDESLHLFECNAGGGYYLVAACDMADARAILIESITDKDEIDDVHARWRAIPDDEVINLPDEDNPSVSDERPAKGWASCGRGMIVEPC